MLAVVVAVLGIANGAAAEPIDFAAMGKYTAIAKVLAENTTAASTGNVWYGELSGRWDDVARDYGAIPSGYSPRYYDYSLGFMRYLSDPKTLVLRSTEVRTSPAWMPDADARKRSVWLLTAGAPFIYGASPQKGAGGLQVAIWKASYDASRKSVVEALIEPNPVTHEHLANEALMHLASFYDDPIGAYKLSTGSWLGTRPGVVRHGVPTPSASADLVLLAAGVLAMLVPAAHRRR